MNRPHDYFSAATYGYRPGSGFGYHYNVIPGYSARPPSVYVPAYRFGPTGNSPSYYGYYPGSYAYRLGFRYAGEVPPHETASPYFVGPLLPSSRPELPLYRSYYPREPEPPRKDTPASVSVRVPADAELFFDGGKTVQKGALRTFVTPPLQPGKEFRYAVKARWQEGGKTVEKTREVRVRAGQDVLLDFFQ
jgi:uncharacterized protein (TIGR03000 family)